MATSKKKNTWIYLLVALIVVLGGIAIWKGKSRTNGEAVEIEAVERRTIQEKVEASGRVFPVTEVKISSDVSGEVVELYVEEGDSVHQGDLLARIDPDTYLSAVERGVAGVNSAKAQAANARSQVENLRAQKEQILAQLENAQQIFERNEQLNKEGVISEQDYETSLSNYKGLQANLRSIEASIRASQESVKASEFAVKSAEATLKELRTSLRRTDIFSPMSGIVSRLNIEKGERVVGTIQMTGTEMMRIADLSQMEVQVEVSENDIPRVALQDAVNIEIDAFVNRKFKGKVTEIDHSAANMPSTTGLSVSLTTDQVTNFIVTIIIDPASYDDLVSEGNPFPFRPGMSASVEILTKMETDVLSVPIQSVTTRERKEFLKEKQAVQVANKEETEDDLVEVVFVVKGDTVDMTEVSTGIQDDSYIQVRKGLEEGQRIVTGPYTAISRKLEQGSSVTEKEEEEK